MKHAVIAVMVIFTITFSVVIFADDVTQTTTNTTSVTGPNTEPAKISPGPTVTHSTTTTTTTTVGNHDDDNIVTAIYGKYGKDPALIGTTLTVSSENGVVSITGTVSAQAQADEAVIAAKKINGVKDVRSSIVVTTNRNVYAPAKGSNY